MKIYGKVYGSTQTRLRLTDKAERAHDNSSYTIVEHYNGTYSIHTDNYPTEYNMVRDNMTAEDVNKWFEDLYVDCRIGKYFWSYESWGSDYLPEDADEVIKDVNEHLASFDPNDPDIEDYSNELWNIYCTTHKLFGKQYLDTIN